MTSIDASHLPQEGDILLGKYKVERVLGQGGMGVVVAARHVQLEEHVAIKFLLPEAMQSAEAVQRFMREARAAVKIKSEHVARVTDVGQLENGAPYMVMEYLEGKDLSGILEERGALPLPEAVGYVIQACEAIAEAHAIGIVHRDLKPANLFLAQRPDGHGSVKVLDFGISKVTSKDSTQNHAMTRTTAIMGSPLYMSPEQMASSRNVDLRTDIYAIGVILHELMTGGPVFMADTMPQLCAMILTEPPPPLRTLRPDAPAELEVVVQRCLAKDPRQRFPNVADLTWALLPFAPQGAQSSVDRITRLVSSSPSATTGDPGVVTGQIKAMGAQTAQRLAFGGYAGAPPVTGNTGVAHMLPGMTGAVPGAQTAQSWSETQGGAQKSNKGMMVAVGAAVAVVGIVGIVAVAFVSTRKAEGGAPAAAAANKGADEVAQRLRDIEEKAQAAELKAKQTEAMIDQQKAAEQQRLEEQRKLEEQKRLEAEKTAAAPAPRRASAPAKTASAKTAGGTTAKKPASDDLFSDRK
jgi:serine/threonine-protein kinase